MTITNKTLAELVVLNDANLADIDVNDLLIDAPFLRALAAVPASNGTDHKWVKQTGLPTATFRSMNAGRNMTKSSETLMTINLKMMDATVTLDQGWAQGYKGGVEAAIAREATRSLQDAFFKTEQQLLIGTVGASASGFSGLADTLTALATTGVVNGVGAGAGTNNRTSIYLVRSSENDIATVVGNDGLISIGEIGSTMIDSGSQSLYPAYFAPIIAWMGMQYGSIYSAARICNISMSGTTSAVNDALIYSGIAKFPSGRQPTHIVMNRDVLEKLRASRTATNATGMPAPRPTEVEGIPIVVTDAITNTEAALV